MSGWIGTVSLVTNVDHTYLDNHRTYRDEAVYTLRQKADGSVGGSMAGSGGGRWTSSSGDCPVATDPWLKWTYNGPASVTISYENGAFVIRPEWITTTLTEVARFSACGVPDQTFSSQGPAPVYVNLIACCPPARVIKASQAAPADARVLKGTETIPFDPVPLIEKSGTHTATLTWDLENAAPTARDDIWRLKPGSVLSSHVNVLKNDSDPNGDALTAVNWKLKRGFRGGTNGRLSYTVPRSAKVGTRWTLAYQARNKRGFVSLPAKVTIQVIRGGQ